jgi:phosphoribosylformimino-5-aminoimidazole carboxamide ribotide isomerase
MELIPAIDLLGGQVVRLAQGAYDRVTIYSDDPIAQARRWVDQGATRLHLVDLDGARAGHPAQSRIVAAIVAAAGVPSQVAGGLRDADTALATGADRAILGSALVRDPALARTLIDRYGPNAIVAAIDVRDGRALGDGWVPGAAGTPALDLIATLAGHGITWFAVTAIARDGLLEGPDLDLLAQAQAAAPAAHIIASAGVSSIEDIEALRSRHYAGAILGRALYDGRLDLARALSHHA